MNLNALHSLMNEKGLKYFTGLSNNEGLDFHFSSVYNGRGKRVKSYL